MNPRPTFHRGFASKGAAIPSGNTGVSCSLNETCNLIISNNSNNLIFLIIIAMIFIFSELISIIVPESSMIVHEDNQAVLVWIKIVEFYDLYKSQIVIDFKTILLKKHRNEVYFINWFYIEFELILVLPNTQKSILSLKIYLAYNFLNIAVSTFWLPLGVCASRTTQLAVMTETQITTNVSKYFIFDKYYKFNSLFRLIAFPKFNLVFTSILMARCGLASFLTWNFMIAYGYGY